MIRAVVRRSTSRTFLLFLGLIVAAEAVAIGVAWLMLDRNISAWIQGQTARLIPISQQAASSADWSRLGEVLDAKNTSLRESYSRRLEKLSRPFFGNEGEVYVVVVDHGHSFEIYPSDPALEEVGKTPPWELEAYSTRRTTYTAVPYSDQGGTYLAAFTPILHNGRVVGLVAAELDSATLAEFQGIVRQAFWFSLLPAMIVSIIVSYALAYWFVDPIEVFRAVEETIQERRSQPSGLPDLWDCLTAREKAIAELARQGLTNPEIANKESISLDTVKTHFKNIRAKTGLKKSQLAVQAQALRDISVRG
jgi:DNA-binding CsgD family transcriptional regulator